MLLYANGMKSGSIANDVINLEHTGTLGIYASAHSNASWLLTYAKTSSPLLNGSFEIAYDNGQAILYLASNYDELMALTRNTNMPGSPTASPPYRIPEVKLYRKHDIWREYDGTTRPDGTICSVPLEAVYCWHGWEKLTIPLYSPEEQTINIEITYRYWSGSSPLTKSVTYTRDIVIGNNNIELKFAEYNKIPTANFVNIT
jgi:hypothetical protein